MHRIGRRQIAGFRIARLPALAPHLDFRGLRVLPDKDGTIEIDGPERAAIYNLPVGASVRRRRN